MKTSNKLIALLFALLFISIIGSSFSLKSKFDKIDQNDPYYGFSSDKLAPFKYIKLTGNPFALVQIQPGQSSEIRVMDTRNYNDRPTVEHDIVGDTLVVLFKRDGKKYELYGEYGLDRTPGVYIFAPSISGVINENVATAISGWKSASLDVHVFGHGLKIENCSFDNLTMNVDEGGFVIVKNKSGMGHTSLTLKDSSTFVSSKDVFKSFDLTSDDASNVQIPVGLMKKANQNEYQ